jgi:hypothetical protein
MHKPLSVTRIECNQEEMSPSRPSSHLHPMSWATSDPHYATFWAIRMPQAHTTPLSGPDLVLGVSISAEVGDSRPSIVSMGDGSIQRACPRHAVSLNS